MNKKVDIQIGRQTDRQTDTNICRIVVNKQMKERFLKMTDR